MESSDPGQGRTSGSFQLSSGLSQAPGACGPSTGGSSPCDIVGLRDRPRVGPHLFLVALHSAQTQLRPLPERGSQYLLKVCPSAGRERLEGRDHVCVRSLTPSGRSVDAC